jgi:hypothetical protein
VSTTRGNFKILSFSILTDYILWTSTNRNNLSELNWERSFWNYALWMQKCSTTWNRTHTKVPLQSKHFRQKHLCAFTSL